MLGIFTCTQVWFSGTLYTTHLHHCLGKISYVVKMCFHRYVLKVGRDILMIQGERCS